MPDPLGGNAQLRNRYRFVNPWASPKHALSRPVVGDRTTERPERCNVRSQASKSRGVRSGSARSAILLFSPWPPCFSVLKNLLGLGRQPGRIIGVPRPANEKMYAFRTGLVSALLAQLAGLLPPNLRLSAFIRGQDSFPVDQAATAR